MEDTQENQIISQEENKQKALVIKTTTRKPTVKKPMVKSEIAETKPVEILINENKDESVIEEAIVASSEEMNVNEEISENLYSKKIMKISEKEKEKMKRVKDKITKRDQTTMKSTSNE